jgi:hypothetical protein
MRHVPAREPVTARGSIEQSSSGGIAGGAVFGCRRQVRSPDAM